MASKLSKKQKRAKKKKFDKKVNLVEKHIKQREEKTQKEHLERSALNKVQEKAMEQNGLPSVAAPGQKEEPIFAVNYVADKNGCGYFRCVWPFELMATYKNVMALNSFIYQTEPAILSKVDVFRFQRQATDSQLKAWRQYIALRDHHGFKYQMHYEIDDLLMEIAPHNAIAYKYFDDKKKQNHLEMLRTADKITFSTQKLKDIYVNDYGIDGSKIHVVRNHLPQFIYSLPYRNTVKNFDNAGNKPRIFWSGSASHLGKGGDLEFLMPLIEKTVDEYKWVFQGVMPPEFEQYVKEGKIEFLPWSPIYGLANIQFYRAKPDICLAPLVPSKFNSAKSDLKYLESCALGAPCITTSFEGTDWKSPYEEADAEICIEPDPDIWKSMIDHLISDPDYYMEVVKKQYSFLNGRWMENNLDAWMNTFK